MSLTKKKKLKASSFISLTAFGNMSLPMRRKKRSSKKLIKPYEP